MPNEFSMFAGVLVRGTVAAQSHTAFLTGSQVNPVPADLNAFGAFQTIGTFDLRDGVKMRATAAGHELTMAGGLELVYLQSCAMKDE